jgi:transposase-like protein
MRKHYSASFKAQVVLELLKEDKTINQIASEYSVHPTQLRQWRAQAVEKLPRVFADDRKAKREQEADHARQMEELYAEIGRLTTRVAWLKKKSGLDYEPGRTTGHD